MSADPKIKKRRRRIYVVTVIILWLIVFFPFTIINYNDGTRTRRMLALIVERNPGARGIFAQIRGNFASGVTLGRYRIETEYGQIIIRSFSEVQAHSHQLNTIRRHGFDVGRATHNLEVNGIPLPRVISVGLQDDIAGVGWYDQETVVSGVSLPIRWGSGWRVIGPKRPDPLSFEGDIPPGNITLADSTRISFPPSHDFWRLIFHKDGTWTFWGPGLARGFFFVKHPGEE